MMLLSNDNYLMMTFLFDAQLDRYLADIAFRDDEAAITTQKVFISLTNMLRWIRIRLEIRLQSALFPPNDLHINLLTFSPH